MPPKKYKANQQNDAHNVMVKKKDKKNRKGENKPVNGFLDSLVFARENIAFSPLQYFVSVIVFMSNKMFVKAGMKFAKNRIEKNDVSSSFYLLFISSIMSEILHEGSELISEILKIINTEAVAIKAITAYTEGEISNNIKNKQIKDELQEELTELVRKTAPDVGDSIVELSIKLPVTLFSLIHSFQDMYYQEQITKYFIMVLLLTGAAATCASKIDYKRQMIRKDENSVRKTLNGFLQAWSKAAEIFTLIGSSTIITKNMKQKLHTQADLHKQVLIYKALIALCAALPALIYTLLMSMPSKDEDGPVASSAGLAIKLQFTTQVSAIFFNDIRALVSLLMKYGSKLQFASEPFRRIEKLEKKISKIRQQVDERILYQNVDQSNLLEVSMKPLQEITESVQNSWDTNTLAKINFSVTKGSYLIIAGSNGSGKTTFLKAIQSAITHLDVKASWRCSQNSLIYLPQEIPECTPLSLAESMHISHFDDVEFLQATRPLIESLLVAFDLEDKVPSLSVKKKQKNNDDEDDNSVLMLQSAETLSGGEGQIFALIGGLITMLYRKEKDYVFLLDECDRAMDVHKKDLMKSTLDYVFFKINHPRLTASSERDEYWNQSFSKANDKLQNYGKSHEKYNDFSSNLHMRFLLDQCIYQETESMTILYVSHNFSNMLSYLQCEKGLFFVKGQNGSVTFIDQATPTSLEEMFAKQPIEDSKPNKPCISEVTVNFFCNLKKKVQKEEDEDEDDLCIIPALSVKKEM